MIQANPPHDPRFHAEHQRPPYALQIKRGIVVQFTSERYRKERCSAFIATNTFTYQFLNTEDAKAFLEAEFPWCTLSPNPQKTAHNPNDPTEKVTCWEAVVVYGLEKNP